ncbi:MAG: putative ABC transport system ATP-binding protein [Bacteroidetes bacterium]|nr:MAG: putative ABC transport system ATP-binding protein [Bacteroidota bacterium]
MESDNGNSIYAKFANGEPVLRVSGLKKSFGTHVVLDGFDLVLTKGENIAVLGRSGSGKSVLIRCLVRLTESDEGIINMLGLDVPDLGQDALDKLRAEIGFLFQSSALYDSMTVRENLEFPLRRHSKHLTQAEKDQMVQEALDNVGLSDTADLMPSELSGGMRKRIGIARTMIMNPGIMLYDEPTTGLDPVTGRGIGKLMLEMKKKYNTSSIIISHDMGCVKQTADRIVVLVNGRCRALGTYAELEKSEDPDVHSFFE